MRKVVLFYLNGVYKKTWDSLKEALDYYKTKHISECCYGVRHKCCGYIWRYEDDLERDILQIR